MINAFVQTLEPRQMLSSGPTLTGVQLLGPVNAVNSIVLTFSGPLDPTTSQNVAGYVFGKPIPGTSDDGFDYTDLLYRKTGREHPDTAKVKAVKKGKIQFSSAVYDATGDTVTLTPIVAFKAKKYFRILRVRGVGADAIDDASGIPFGGGVDEVAKWKLQQGKTVRYNDSQGNNVALRLHGAGKLYVFLRRGNDPDPVIFVDGVNSATSIAATALHGKFSAVTDIAEVNGGQGISNALLNNPTFSVQAIVP
ncbi:MAG TPA: hypothetical protein VG326_05125 [Tepidisphaeraceae bacterium]|jgi:hypothetical protein|nr:hypothetical protein [Tepidisphaeraceae bacterium]